MRRRSALLALVALVAFAAPVRADEAAAPAGLPAAGLQPLSLSIPRLGTSAPIVPVGLEEDGAMAAPTDPDTVGWYELGPGVGVPGNAVLAGHVDWAGRLRAFGRLRDLAAGDRIVLAAPDGGALAYQVEWNVLVDADTAPVAELFAQSPREELTLITCGGEFDPATRQYLGRVVVRAVRENP